MSDSSSSANSTEEPGSMPGRGAAAAYPGMPRWVKLGGIVTGVVLLLVVLVMVLAGGQHGPMRHTPSSSGEGIALTAVRV